VNHLDRQEQILDLVSYGHTYAATAHKLGIGHASVTSHLRRLYARLDAESAAHAVRRGFETGVLTADPSDVLGLRAECDTLRVELGRVYAALAEANSRLVSHAEIPVVAHPFGEYLLGLRDVA
jgi:DNA-binding CsgD family transcriptional regulator